MSESPLLRTVVDAISDGTQVNWEAAERAAGSLDERALLQQLKAISTVAAPDRAGVHAGAPTRIRRAAAAYKTLVALAAVKVTVGAAAWALVIVAGRALPPWPYITNLVVFGLAAAVLWWGARDWRARSLGAFFLLIACAFSDRLLLEISPGTLLSPVARLLRSLPLDACIAFALWLFVWFFPAPPLHARDRWLTRFFLGLSLVVAGLLGLAHLILELQAALGGRAPLALSSLATLATTVDRRAAHTWYPLLQFAPTVPALPYLLWKARFEAVDERRRTAFFVVPLVLGMTPMIVAVVVSPFVPFFDDPSNRRSIGLFLYLALISVVPLTAHGVLVRRVMDFELLLTRARQHALVRRLAWLAVVLPLLSLVLYVYLHRDMTVTEIVWTPTTVLFLPGALLALVVVSFRRRISQAIDRRFLLAPPAYPEVLARLDRDFRPARGVREVATILTRETDRAVHPRTTAVLVPDKSGRRLTSLTGPPCHLAVDSTLGRFLRLARDEIYAGVDASGPVGRLLPDDERRWLVEHGFQLFVPLLGSSGDLLGTIVVGEKRSGQPFSTEDRLVLATMAGQAAVVLENHALRDASFRHLARRAGRDAGAIHWDDEPGAICEACQTMWPAETSTCRCGHATVPAALPVMIRGKFRVERLIGSGGMGVVYLAVDIALDRKVAIKTLPRLTPDRAVRLEREARAMAAVLHPNLAMIFGVERWRGAPLLIAEYVDGGTLAQRLRSGPQPWSNAIALGIVLADVLDQVHASGVLHRDIKPTNVGFTSKGVPKLLDFGIAIMTRDAGEALDVVPPPDTTADAPTATTSTTATATSLTNADRVLGTPLYVSPEALAGAEPDPSFDLWSLALVLYEAIAGQHPFAAPTTAEVFEMIHRAQVPDLRTFCTGCPDPLAELLARALSPEPARRPQSAAELRQWLQRVRADLHAG